MDCLLSLPGSNGTQIPPQLLLELAHALVGGDFCHFSRALGVTLAAVKGFATAQNNLGEMYRLGHGVPQDYAEAMRWYRRAAEGDLPIAQSNLGTVYLAGLGVRRDYVEAARWYRLAAEQRFARA